MQHWGDTDYMGPNYLKLFLICVILAIIMAMMAEAEQPS